jgi:hypothetical protein
MTFTPPWPGAERLGARPASAVTEQELEAFIRHLETLGRRTATRNHYVRILRVLESLARAEGVSRHADSERSVGRDPETQGDEAQSTSWPRRRGY